MDARVEKLRSSAEALRLYIKQRIRLEKGLGVKKVDDQGWGQVHEGLWQGSARDWRGKESQEKATDFVEKNP